ncbi:hypothetical protein M407DRAFT_106912 [Tulasnella calospora MUT 4182]|uniref:Uncharacterized protein n=1 Tax=Tulasnella calospora MUT 4182 TaxID=1051891 RepID=A0A0C3QF82_9AGAM|nr:hypothetical protein M407DRAFT_106912 [Tulasnella calospora MUT 4182]
MVFQVDHCSRRISTRGTCCGALIQRRGSDDGIGHILRSSHTSNIFVYVVCPGVKLRTTRTNIRMPRSRRNNSNNEALIMKCLEEVHNA